LFPGQGLSESQVLIDFDKARDKAHDKVLLRPGRRAYLELQPGTADTLVRQPILYSQSFSNPQSSYQPLLQFPNLWANNLLWRTGVSAFPGNVNL
jgi:hypothetical protein